MSRSHPAVLAIAALAALIVERGSLRAEMTDGSRAEGTRTVLVEIPPDGDLGGPVIQSAGALRAAAPVIIYLNADGGIYTPGQPNDSHTNVSSVAKATVQVPPWEAGAEERRALLDCVADLFAPFSAVVTDQDPGDAPHLEAVVGGLPGSFGLEPDVAGVSPFLTNCGVIDDSIVFIYPLVVGSDPRRLCETVAQEVAHSFGLDHEYLCEDPMTYLTGCGDKEFLFQDSVCGEFEARDCKCSRSQNSARLLLERLGRGERPTVWLSQPSPGDVLAAGFPVQAAITRAPALLELYVDGLLAGSVVPVETGDAYQLVDFDTSDTLRSGTHQVELVARYESQNQSVAALVEVKGVDQEDVVTEGCAVGRRGTGGAAAGVLLIAMVLARRPRSRRSVAARLFAAALGVLGGCKTSVLGGGPGDIASGCPVAGDVGPAIGVLWSPAGGTCTATLVGGSALITAAHCVADADPELDPVVSVLGGRQYIAGLVELYPDWQPGAAADDVAVVTVTRVVEEVEPLVIAPVEPLPGDPFTIIGHGEWMPDDARDAERQAQVGAASDVQARSFSYEDAVEDQCLAGRGGGLVVAGGSPARQLGLHGEDRRIMRLDQYACWLACGAGADVVATVDGCDCFRADWRPCGDCGAEFLDYGSRTWSVCEGAERLRPCGEGLTCDGGGTCVAPPPA